MWTRRHSGAAGLVLMLAWLPPAFVAPCSGQTPGPPNLGAAATPLGPRWMLTGSLAEPRVFHTATLMANGKVLVVGGWDGSKGIAGVELYDPAGGTWSHAAPLNAPRAGHTATLLQDGRVLVVGGGGGFQNYVPDFAELYDPLTNTWSKTSSISGRSDSTATLLQNGSVLIAGGSDSAGKFLTTGALFTPATGDWRTIAGLADPRVAHQATLLQDGRVLVTGGWDPFGVDIGSAELYDPLSGTWKGTNGAGPLQGLFTTTLMPNGLVLAAGGALAIAELFDPSTEHWNAAGSLRTAREACTASLLANGSVLVAGGIPRGPGILPPVGSAELYDPNSSRWEPTGGLLIPRYAHTATRLLDGRVLVAGGRDAIGVINSAELYGTIPINSFRMTAMFTDQAGLFQYIQLQELSGLNDQHHFTGLTLVVKSGSGVVKTVTFPNDLPDSNTAGRYVMVGTTLGPPVDFALPPGFIPTDGGTLYFAGFDTWAYPVLPADGHAVLLRDNTFASNPPLTAAMIFRSFLGLFTGLGVPIDPIIEYYNASLDHYFITGSQPDIDALDSHRTPGWSRTGESFPAYISNLRQWFDKPPDLLPVCRYWIPPAVGDSHFFSVSSGECAAAQALPNYVLETDKAFYASLPNAQTGECLYDQMPVYRLWNGRLDSNHRYTSSSAIRDVMKAKGYIAEGYGPNAVAMCVGGGIPSE